MITVQQYVFSPRPVATTPMRTDLIAKQTTFRMCVSDYIDDQASSLDSASNLTTRLVLYDTLQETLYLILGNHSGSLRWSICRCSRTRGSSTCRRVWFT